MKIMIVDDNPAMCETIKKVLSKTGAVFYQCHDGHTAVTSYNEIHPDWVLMDIRMGDDDGLKATEAIKDTDPQARVIIVTNYDDPDFRAEATRLKTDGYVLKEHLRDLRAIIGIQ
jgi:two-component system chemotaxis response regulator CheY